MNSAICVDASILIKLLVEEENSDLARSLWQSWLDAGIERVAPPLLIYEIIAVLRKQVYRGLITAQEGDEAFNLAQDAPVSLLAPSGLHRLAWEFAKRFNRPTAYDSHYLALAELLNCAFWTADERLFNTVKIELPWVRWLGDYAGGE
jgi:predicted nucleic acid-binding protein